MRSSGSGKKQNFFWRHFNGIAMAAIVLIPTIYTTLFLGSMWDPYGNVDQLPVAVVNNDKSVDYEGKELAVGDELVDKLRENDQLDFHFVSADKAEKGIEDGTYYMVITIPENFSENASTLMDDEPQKMELQYVTNPGTNYIASKMSETALAKIQKEVSESVTKEYTETIFDQLGTIGSGMSDAADGALQIQDGVSDLKDGNTKITDNLKLLSDSSLTFVDGAKTLESGLKTYTDGVATVNSGAQTLSDGMDQLASGAGTLADGAVALSDGSGTLSNGVSSYTDGVSAAYSGAQTLDGSSSQLENGAASLTSGAAQLQQGSAQMTAGLQTLSDSLSGSLSAESLQQMQQLTAGLTQLQQGIDTLNTTLQNTSMPDTSALVQTLTASLTAIGTSAQDAGAQLQSLQSALTTMTQTEVFQSLDAASQQELLSCFSVPMSSLATDISDIGTQVTGLSKALEGTDLSSSASAMEQLKSSVSTLAAGADQALPGAQQAITSLSWINDFQPEYMGKTLIIACLASVAFLTLEYCVNFFLDIIGDFILLVFMVLQLSGCAGTYPLELSDKFYQVLNPFMPFTYTVHGFRSGIASGLDITTDCVVLAVIAVVFAGLLLVGFRKRAKKEQESEVEVSEKAVSGTPVQA